MDEQKSVQPNVRCTFCSKVFYVTPRYGGIITCYGCGSIFISGEIKLES